MVISSGPFQWTFLVVYSNILTKLKRIPSSLSVYTLMVDISVGERDLHIYSGSFIPSSSARSSLPRGFRVMRNGRRARRRGGSRSSNQYLPVVVLNSQQPLTNSNNKNNNNNGLAQSRMDNYNYNQQQQQQQGGVTRGAEKWPGAFELPDLTFGLFGSRSSDFGSESKSSGPDMYGSHQFGGGSGCGGSGGLSTTDLLLFFAALAASVFFLNQAIN